MCFPTASSTGIVLNPMLFDRISYDGADVSNRYNSFTMSSSDLCKRFLLTLLLTQFLTIQYITDTHFWWNVVEIIAILSKYQNNISERSIPTSVTDSSSWCLERQSVVLTTLYSFTLPSFIIWPRWSNQYQLLCLLHHDQGVCSDWLLEYNGDTDCFYLILFCRSYRTHRYIFRTFSIARAGHSKTVARESFRLHR